MTGDYWDINSQGKLNHFISYLKTEWAEKHWLLVQVKDGAKPTKNQRDWMHPVFREIGRQLTEREGQEFGEQFIKTTMKRNFGLIGTKLDPVTRKPVPYLLSTEKEYTRGEKCEFMEKVLVWAAGIDITIDPPEQYKKMQREQLV